MGTPNPPIATEQRSAESVIWPSTLYSLTASSQGRVSTCLYMLLMFTLTSRNWVWSIFKVLTAPPVFLGEPATVAMDAVDSALVTTFKS